MFELMFFYNQGDKKMETIAQTILNELIKQFGTFSRFQNLLRADDFVSDLTSLSFSFKGKKLSNKVKISLNDSNDTYRMEFFKNNQKVEGYKGLVEKDFLRFFEEGMGLPERILS